MKYFKTPSKNQVKLFHYFLSFLNKSGLTMTHFQTVAMALPPAEIKTQNQSAFLVDQDPIDNPQATPNWDRPSSPEQSSFDEVFKYYLDTPEIDSPATLTLRKNFIIFSLPKMYTPSMQSEGYFHYNNLKSVQIYINNKLSFSTHWIPIFTQEDWHRVMDMFYRGYYTFLVNSQLYMPNDISTSNLHNEKKTILTNKDLSLTVVENIYNTIVQVDIVDPIPPFEFASKNPSFNLPQVQIFFEDQLFFCTQTFFSHFSTSTFYTIVPLLLSKLIKW